MYTHAHMYTYIQSCTGRYKTWTPDSGLDYGLDHGLDYGLDYGQDYELNFGLDCTVASVLALLFKADYEC